MFPSFEETPRNGERHSLQARCPTPPGRTATIFRCSLPKAMSISRSEFFRKKGDTENEKSPSVMVLESVSWGHL